MPLRLLWPLELSLSFQTPSPKHLHRPRVRVCCQLAADKLYWTPPTLLILLLDHQAGLFQTVKDIGVAELRSNTVMLAKLATLMKIPVITTAS